MKSLKGAKPVVAVLAAMAMFMGMSVASASAAELTKFTNPVVPPTTVEVEGTGFGAFEAKNVRVGICAAKPIEFVPPCGNFATNVAIDGSGVLTASTEVESAVIVNDHFGVTPKQPATFNCEVETCGVLVVNHPEGGSQTVLDFEALTFE